MSSKETLCLSDKIVDGIHHVMGWCPMAASVQKELPGRTTGIRPEKADATGPVAGRAVFYSRLTWVVVGLSYLIALAALPHLPEIIPIHWNMFGEADGFVSRLPGAFGLPLVITLTAVLLTFLPRFDSWRETLNLARDIYSIAVLSTVSMLLVLEVITLLSSAGMDLPVGILIPMLVGLFFIVIGGLMPHIGRNTIMGFRFPWTLSDERVWKKTHEHGGPVFVAAGVLVVLASPLAGIWAVPLMLGIVVTAGLYITIYSYRVAKTGTSL
jgi:uncharacterized membrane protein